MERLTEKSPTGKSCIPLKNAAQGIGLPKWSIRETSCLERRLEGDAADRLAAYEDTGLSPDEIPRWIAVGERLPDPKDMKHIQVFVIQKSTITGRPNIMSVARWNGTDWVRRGVEIARVTHWAYLPQPPKDGAK